jgi:hypothetical protein
MKRLFLVCAILLLTAGCISLPWVKTEGPYTATAQNISADLPEGWMRHNSDQYLFITKDGPLLQYIMVERIHHDGELKYTKKKFRRGMLPDEIAGIIIDNQKSNENVLNMKVETNKPAMINGNPGFEMTFTYKDKRGLEHKSLYYGFMKGDWFYGIRYNAPQRHYYEKELKTFRKFVESLRVAA